ncbi:MAG: helix-hairpin-helix domain-containing protein [Rubrivivax sp.]|nr:helix-hairpin-helix domain-containing protein [Rubrivivax sp.]
MMDTAMTVPLTPPTRAPRPLRAEVPARPPKAPPPRKARHADECERLEQLPNIGPSIAGDLRSLGIAHPRELAARDALQLYQQLCRHTGRRQDPCVLDTFMAAVDFMRGAEARPWWTYTAERKQRFGVV